MLNVRLAAGQDAGRGERDLEKGLLEPSTPGARSEPPMSPRTSKALLLSNSSKSLLVSSSSKSLMVSNSSKSLMVSNSGKSLMASNSGKSLMASNSGKRMDQAGRKKYVRQVTGRFNDTELHLAAKRGDVAAVKHIIGEIDSQMMGTLSGAEFDAEVAEIRSAVVNEVNELGETPLFAAAEKGYLGVVKELLPYTTTEGIYMKNRVGYDPLHIAASQGHHAIVQVLLDHEPGLTKTLGPSNATALVSAATRGHIEVIKVLLSQDHTLLEISKSNGKNALHFAARQGHVDIVKALLDKDPQLVRRTDKKGQTALHMAVKGHSWEVVKLLVNADSALVMLPDKFGNLALHVATRKKRTEIVNELLAFPDTNVNALTRDQKTSLDIAEALPLSEESTAIKESLTQYGGLRAQELNQPRDELKNTVSAIKKDVQTQLEQARKTSKSVTGIAKEIRKLQREAVNTAANSVTLVASLIATLAFAAIFTVPGGDLDSGLAVTVGTTPFKMFYFCNAISLFVALSVVVVQITLVRGETKTERRVTQVINKAMWLASMTTTVAFISSSYIVVGRRNRWAAIVVTVIGGFIISAVLGIMTYFVIKSKKIQRVRKREKLLTRTGSALFTDDSGSEVNRVFAL
ncbi:ankyrin repeat-containing protein ITN1-like [Argentina anserina]|uniref:ankyrin repeat-containing protein ITN1-like n=1 Tax=Argentina anserina TaxID=57926 RepID=UPI002176891C|nr:ankyrin repeat-containing protein ITN1-like [Potentilla anserina]